MVLDWAELDAYLVEWINTENPGVSLAVVENDSITAKGYGVKRKGESGLVDAHTLFQTGSLTKSMTAALVGMLVDEKKMDWDDPVILYLPEFNVDDPYITENLTVRDVLTARSGIIGGDTLQGTREEIIGKMRHIKPTGQFRLTIDSVNLHYLLAGQIVAAVEGKPWDDIVKERLLTPLTMKETYTSISSALPFKNVASPHKKIGSTIKPIPWVNYEHYGPAEGIVSNVCDMAQWVRLHLNKGVFNNNQLLSTDVCNELHTPQMILNDYRKNFFNPYAVMAGAGLTWIVSDYKGVKVLDHFGIVEGMVSFIGMIPEKQIGTIIMTNRHRCSALVTSLKFRMYDAVIEDW